MTPLQQRIETLRHRLSRCGTAAECDAIELELREIKKAHRRQGESQKAYRKRGRRPRENPPRGSATLTVALFGPGHATQHEIEGYRVGENLVVHPSIRTAEEVVEAGSDAASSWAVTHVPTGQLIATVRTKDWAKRLANEIARFAGPGLASADVLDVQLAVGGSDMAGAGYIDHVSRISWDTPSQRGSFPAYREWSEHSHELNPANSEDRKSRAAVGAAIGALVGGIAGVVVGAVGGGLLGLVLGGIVGGGQGAVGGLMVGGVFGIVLGPFIGTIWGAVRQTDKALGGVDAGSAKLGAGIGAGIGFGPIGAGVGAYLGA